MKTDKFDEILRKKIESIQPVFQEADWERFSTFAGAQTVSFWSSFWGKTLLYSVGTTAFVGLIAWNLTQFYAQKSLLQSVQNLTQQVDSLQRRNAIETLEKPVADTVYITRYFPSSPSVVGSINSPKEDVGFEADETTELPNDLPNSADGQIVTEKRKPNAPNRNLIAATPETNNNVIEKEFNLTNRARVNGKSRASNLLSVRGQKTAGRRRRTNGRNDSKLANEQADGSTSALETTNLPPNAIIAENNLQLATNEVPLNLEMLPIMGFDSNSNLKKAKIRVRYRTAYYETPKPLKSGLVLPKLSVRVGVGTDFGMEQFSPNAMAEFFIGKRFSIASGLKVNYLRGKNYFTDEQFDKKNRKDFRGQYAPRVPPGVEILNISEKNHVVQIPLRLSYYQPFKNNFWLTTSVGSDLDLSGSKRISFDFRQQRSEFDRGNYQSSFPTVLFNNVVFSAGIEKRFNRFAFQISPNWTFQTREVAYRREGGSSLGGQFRAWVRF